MSYYKDQVFYSFLLVWSIFSSIQLDFHWDHNIICLYILSSAPKTYFNCFSKCRASAVGPQIKCVQYWSKSCLHHARFNIPIRWVQAELDLQQDKQALYFRTQQSSVILSSIEFCLVFSGPFKSHWKDWQQFSPLLLTVQPWLWRHIAWFCLPLPHP